MRRGGVLFDGPSIAVPRELARLVGLNEAIVLQQVHYLCWPRKNDTNLRDGKYWVYKSYPDWNKEFPWWGETTIKTTFRNLEKKGLLVSGVFNKKGMDRTKWYRVNYDALEALRDTPSDGIHPMDEAKSDRPIPKNYKNNKNGFSAEKPMQENPAQVDGANIDIDEFIDWYFGEYKRVYGIKHPNIRADQRSRIAQALLDFVNDPEFDICGNEDLEDMAISFFEEVESNDWRINHFATPGVLKTRYYEVIWNQR